MMNSIIRSLSLALVLFAPLSVAKSKTKSSDQSSIYKISKQFALPAAPTRASLPSKKLPSLGRDKHGMPFFHPKQLTRLVRTTAYTHSESDHLVYGRKNAIGTRLLYSDTIRSAAADWSVYPVGTKFKIKGLPHTYVVDDYGGALVGTGTIDIYKPTRALMNKWGRRFVEIQVIEWGSSKRSIEKLASRTQHKHCARMRTALLQQQRYRKAAKR